MLFERPCLELSNPFKRSVGHPIMLDVPSRICRRAPYCYNSRYLCGYYGAGRDHGVVSDGDAGENYGICANPHVLADHDGGRETVVAVCRVQVMVAGSEDYTVADGNVVSRGSALLPW